MRQFVAYLIFGLILLASSSAWAQEVNTPCIKVRAEVYSDRVLLRWLASDAKTWELLNKYGVKLERLTIARNGQVLKTPEQTILADILKPRETDELKRLASKYPMGLVMAQAVFGEEFEVELGKGDIAKAVALDEQRQQRYLFASYAADLCYPVAKEMGWGWEDKTVKTGERYLYRVLALNPEKKKPIQEGVSFVVMGKNTQLVRPQALSAHFSDTSVLLSWDYSGLVHLYNSYIVERSEDGEYFTTITPEPITRIADGVQSPYAPITYTDSIPNHKTFYYRVVGLTPFGTKSPYSHVVSGEGYPSLKAIPMISAAYLTQQGAAQIVWTFPSEEEALLEGFNILLSTNDKKYTLLKQGLSPSERSYTIDKPKAKHIYYKIEAKPKRGIGTQSLPILLQSIDSIPPTIPIGLKAEIDSLGGVQLSWRANTEADILGYRLYRAETKGEELIPITDIAIQDTLYRDSVNLRSLNGHVYYALTALDVRYNQSEQSETIEVLKPNSIPPLPPVITSIETLGRNTQITWVTVEDPYLAGFILFRKEQGSNTLHQFVRVEDKAQRTYTLTEDATGKSYSYFIQAYSTRGLRSTMSEPMMTRTSVGAGESDLVSLSLTPLSEGAISIKWKTTRASLISLTLYKTNDEGKLYVYRENLPAEGELIDEDTRQGKSNDYTLIVKRKGAKPQTIKRSVVL